MDFLQLRVSESSQGKSPYSWSSFDSQVDTSFFLSVILTAFSVLATLESPSGPLLPWSPPPPRKPFGQNFSCYPQGHIFDPGNPHSSPHLHQAGAALAARIVLRSAPARSPKLFASSSVLTDFLRQTPCTVSLGEPSGASSHLPNTGNLLGNCSPSGLLSGGSTPQPPKRQWGLRYIVEEVSFWPPLHTLSNLFLYS